MLDFDSARRTVDELVFHDMVYKFLCRRADYFILKYCAGFNIYIIRVFDDPLVTVFKVLSASRIRLENACTEYYDISLRYEGNSIPSVFPDVPAITAHI